MPFINSGVAALFSALERLGSKPRDLYTFARSDQMWRYTSAGKAISVTYGATSLTYQPAVISRDRIQRGSETGAMRVHIKIARTVPVAAALYEYRMHPMVLGIHRYQVDPTALPVLQAYGDIAGVTLNEGWVECDLVSGESLFDQPFPRVIFAQTCQLPTYEWRCGLNKDDFSHDSAISLINGSTITVTTVPAVADDYFDGGEIYIPSTREHLYVTTRSTNVFQVFGPIPDGIALGEPVKLIAGDDHSLATCKAKFNNVPNFLGFNDLPISDPMSTGIITV